MSRSMAGACSAPRRGATSRVCCGCCGASAISGEISDELCAAARRGYLALFIDFFFETPLRRDLDGGLKIAQDAICTALEVNDNRVVDIHLVKRIDPLNPRIEIELEVLDDWSFEYEREVLAR